MTRRLWWQNANEKASRLSTHHREAYEALHLTHQAPPSLPETHSTAPHPTPERQEAERLSAERAAKVEADRAQLNSLQVELNEMRSEARRARQEQAEAQLEANNERSMRFEVERMLEVYAIIPMELARKSES